MHRAQNDLDTQVASNVFSLYMLVGWICAMYTRCCYDYMLSISALFIDMILSTSPWAVGYIEICSPRSEVGPHGCGARK